MNINISFEERDQLLNMDLDTGDSSMDNGFGEAMLLAGPPGMSAYEVALSNGFAGTEEEWLASLHGERGKAGPAGPAGERGPQGEQGDPGIQGPAGAAGRDGADGKDGKDGIDGRDGVSATHSWNGTVLTITSASGTSSADLEGARGAAGKDGYTPVRGTDYWTEADKREIVEEVAASIPSSASPDWNANEGEAGYIQNRTHWVSSGFDEIYNGVLSFSSNSSVGLPWKYDGIAMSKYPNAGTVPEFVYVFIDGVKYQCPVGFYVSTSGTSLDEYKVAIGDNDYVAFTTSYRGYNALIVLCTDGLVNKVFTIGYDGDFYHTLDERYIPNTIARTKDIPQMWEIIDNVIAALPRYNGEVADV